MCSDQLTRGNNIIWSKGTTRKRVVSCKIVIASCLLSHYKPTINGIITLTTNLHLLTWKSGSDRSTKIATAKTGKIYVSMKPKTRSQSWSSSSTSRADTKPWCIHENAMRRGWMPMRTRWRNSLGWSSMRRFSKHWHNDKMAPSSPVMTFNRHQIFIYVLRHIE